LMRVGHKGKRRMTPANLRALALRCEKAARECSDLFAKEEFRSLAYLFEAQAASARRPVDYLDSATAAEHSLR
jgi:hypothetical protein